MDMDMGRPPPMPCREFFTIDEVAVMRFMAICIPSLSPDRYSDFIGVCEALCKVRPHLREGCIERIEGYLSGRPSPAFDNLGHRVLDS